MKQPELEPLFPGIYANEQGEWHVDGPTMLEVLGRKVTPENLNILEEEIRRYYAERRPEIEVVDGGYEPWP